MKNGTPERNTEIINKVFISQIFPLIPTNHLSKINLKGWKVALMAIMNEEETEIRADASALLRQEFIMQILLRFYLKFLWTDLDIFGLFFFITNLEEQVTPHEGEEYPYCHSLVTKFNFSFGYALKA